MYFLSPTVEFLTGLNSSSNSYWTILSTVTMWDCSDNSEILKPPHHKPYNSGNSLLVISPHFLYLEIICYELVAPGPTHRLFFWPLQVLANIQCLPHLKGSHQVKIKKLGLIRFWQHQANSQQKLNGSWVITWFIFQWEILSTVRGCCFRMLLGQQQVWACMVLGKLSLERQPLPAGKTLLSPGWPSALQKTAVHHVASRSLPTFTPLRVPAWSLGTGFMTTFGKRSRRRWECR